MSYSGSENVPGPITKLLLDTNTMFNLNRLVMFHTSQPAPFQ